MGFLPLDNFNVNRSDLASDMIDCGEDQNTCPVCGAREWMTLRFWVSGNDNSRSLSPDNDPKLVRDKIVWLKCLNCERTRNGLLTVIEASLPSLR